MEYIKLNTGENMPIIGTGTNTYGKQNNEYQGKLTNDFRLFFSLICNEHLSI